MRDRATTIRLIVGLIVSLGIAKEVFLLLRRRMVIVK